LVAYGRSSRRAGSSGIVLAIYVAVWAAIGAASYLVMSRVMPPSGLWVAAVAVLFAALYALVPWSRRGRAQCQEMCREPAGDPVRGGLMYAANCVACSAGVMVAVVIMGMSNLALMAAAAAVVLLLKWPKRSTPRPGSLSPEGDVALSP
jgi:hypothetical protein